MKLILDFDNVQELPSILDCVKMQINAGNMSGACPDWYIKANPEPLTLNIDINKTITILLKPDDMGRINQLIGIEINSSDNWVDFQTFEYIPDLKEFINREQYNALRVGAVDYIVFRIDY